MLDVERLRSLPLERLRNIEVVNPEDEAILQKIVDEKTAMAPLERKVDVGIVPDIKSPEEEAIWQAKVDARVKEMRGQVATEEEPLPVDPTDVPEEELPQPEVLPEPEIQPETQPVQLPTENRFCQFCDSKGVKHKKVCTRPK